MGRGLGETPKAQAADGGAPVSMGRGTRGSVCGESGPDTQRVEAQEPLRVPGGVAWAPHLEAVASQRPRRSLWVLEGQRVPIRETQEGGGAWEGSKGQSTGRWSYRPETHQLQVT